MKKKSNTSPDTVHLAIGTEVFLPHSQIWIYRQLNPQYLKLILCNETMNGEDFPCQSIAVVPHRSLFLRKIIYKLQPVLKYFPFFISAEKWKAYYKALRLHRINLLHVHFGVMGVELMDVCRYAKIPLIVTFHGYDITSAVKRSPSYQKALKRLFSSLTYAVAISEEMKTRLIQLGCTPDKIRVAYLGVPTDQFEYINRRERKGTVRFLHAGRFSATKGVPDLVRAFSSAFTEEDDVELIIVGQGEQKEDIQQAIANSVLKHKIRLEGPCKNTEMSALLKSADVFVLNSRTPSTGDQEGLPIALLEAASTGLPVISTVHAGIPEAVKNGVTGILVEEYDQLALSQALQKMLDQEVRILYGQEGRRFMEEKFDLKKCNAVLTALYQQAVHSSLVN